MDVIQVGKEYYCSKCLTKFAKRFNALRHFRNFHRVTLQPQRSSANNIEPDNSQSDIDFDNDHHDIEFDNSIYRDDHEPEEDLPPPDSNETLNDQNIDQLLEATLHKLQIRQDEEGMSSSSEHSDDEENEISIDDNWVFNGSKISIKEHASSVLGI